MKNRLIKTVALLVLVLLALQLAACGSTGSSGAASSGGASVSASQDGERQVLRVGMECAYAPFNWTQLDDSNGAVPLGDGTYAGGYDVEIAKLIAEALDMDLQVVKIEWDGLPPSLTSGKIDLIIAGMTDEPDRRETIDFTESYYTSDLVMVVRKDSPFAAATSLADFYGARVTGQLNTLHYKVIDQIEGVDKQPAMKDFPTMVVALTSGTIDGYVSERPGALSAIATNDALTFVSFADGDGFDYTTGEVSVAIGVRKEDTDLRDRVSAALANISAEQRGQLMEAAVQNQPLA